MANNISGIAKYQQTNQVWKKNSTEKTGKTANTEEAKATGKVADEVKVSEWKPVEENSPLIPKTKSGYGNVIGDVELSENAQKYYNELKSKFHGMEFILVSSDQKDQVAKNASAYGCSGKTVVLIDSEKIEKMASDPSYRKKYEGIIASSQAKLEEAMNSIKSSGAKLFNIGMSVSSDGRASFFATVEKANNQAQKIVEKRREEKKEAKVKEKKKAEKEEKAEKLEKRREASKAQKAEAAEKAAENTEEEAIEETENREYIQFEADSLDALINKVAGYAYASSANSVMTPEESMIGGNFDFRG